jgi:hypothetical protein
MKSQERKDNMKYIREFNNFKSDLIIIDVQKSFKEYFTDLYLEKLNEHCKLFTNVYQVWDNHSDDDADSDYLYDPNPTIPVHGDLYTFPNQRKLIEKRYNYDVDADFYKKILSDETHAKISKAEDSKTIKRGDMFPTKEGTVITYIGNAHKWFHCPKKLYNLLNEHKGKSVEIVGGSDGECLDDVFILAEKLGVLATRNHQFIYSATHCPL